MTAEPCQSECLVSSALTVLHQAFSLALNYGGFVVGNV